MMASFTVYVGTYTYAEPTSRSDGIFIYRLDGITGELTFVGAVGEVINPSFLSISPDHRFLYAVNEVNEFNGLSGGGLTAFAIDAKSSLIRRLNAQPTLGATPCYISNDSGLAFVANYGGGSLSILPISEDGHLGSLIQVIHYHGSSINPRRQDAPHVHSVILDPAARFALVADLGTDTITIYHLDRSSGTTPLVKVHEVSVEAGSGPRHMAFHPTRHFLYLANELSSRVTAFAYNEADGRLQSFQNILALPEDFAGTNITGDIHISPSGRHLYVSNRGHDSIAIFAIDQSTGHLTIVAFVPTQGRTPRNFSFDPSGNWLLVANQDSDNLVPFKTDPVSGQLVSTGQVTSVPRPACVRIVALDDGLP
jgi:6-phosphogluconolactonase